MKLGLAISSVKGSRHGVDAIGMKNMNIIDTDTGEIVENKVGWLWGGKELMTESGEPLLTEEHFANYPDDASYVVLVFRCDEAMNANMDNV